MTNHEAIAAKLLQINAIKLSIDEPFTWAGGWKSPIYCDNRKALSFPFIREFIKSEMCNEIFQSYEDADLLAGVATAGIAWGAMAADQLKLPYIYVRPKPKAHGLGNQIEGYYEPGKRVVVVEDLVSTGKSSLEVVEVLRNAGLEVLGMVCIFTYGFDEAQRNFDKYNVNLNALTSYETLIKLATEQKLIPENASEELMKWRRMPEKWRQPI